MIELKVVDNSYSKYFRWSKNLLKTSENFKINLLITTDLVK